MFTRAPEYTGAAPLSSVEDVNGVQLVPPVEDEETLNESAESLAMAVNTYTPKQYTADNPSKGSLLGFRRLDPL